MLKLGSLDADSEEVRGAALRPNPGALVGKSAFADDDDEDADEEAGDDGLDGSDIEDDLADSKKSREPQKLYKAPKIAAMPYKVCTMTYPPPTTTTTHYYYYALFFDSPLNASLATGN